MIGIYAGEGASHSWTWFISFLEARGSRGYRFLEGSDLREDRLEGLRAVLIGGGDVEAIARELGEKGARALEGFVGSGGLYFGSCAGAYLVMEGVDLPPYTPFRLIEAGIANYSPAPPPPLNLPHKYKVAYGRGFVFHPAYGPVWVEMQEGSFLGELGTVAAALYGGPVIVPGKGCERLAVYRGPHAGCLPMVEERLLLRLLQNTCAAACGTYGRGRVYICGPHFECPYYPEGGRVLERILQEENIFSARERKQAARLREGRARRDREMRSTAPAAEPKAAGLLEEVRRELSNLRIAARWMESFQVRWKLGAKVWEPEKIIYYADFLWDRADALKECAAAEGAAEDLEELTEKAAGARLALRELRSRLERGEEGLSEAEDLFRRLRILTMRLLECLRDRGSWRSGLVSSGQR